MREGDLFGELLFAELVERVELARQCDVLQETARGQLDGGHGQSYVPCHLKKRNNTRFTPFHSLWKRLWTPKRGLFFIAYFNLEVFKWLS